MGPPGEAAVWPRDGSLEEVMFELSVLCCVCVEGRGQSSRMGGYPQQEENAKLCEDGDGGNFSKLQMAGGRSLQVLRGMLLFEDEFTAKQHGRRKISQ